MGEEPQTLRSSVSNKIPRGIVIKGLLCLDCLRDTCCPLEKGTFKAPHLVFKMRTGAFKGHKIYLEVAIKKLGMGGKEGAPCTGVKDPTQNGILNDRKWEW